MTTTMLNTFAIGYKDGYEDIKAIAEDAPDSPYTTCAQYAHDMLGHNHALTFLETVSIGQIIGYLECDISSIDDAFKSYTLGYEKCMKDFLVGGLS